MCGLVGYAGQSSISAEKAFRDMLITDTIRGWNSTGVLFVHGNGKVHVLKDTVIGLDMVLSTQFEERMKQINNVLLGHNRAATKGKVNRKNAHPFICDHIIGAHNGTLFSVYDIDGNKYDTDSEAIFAFIARKGLDETWSKIDGAAALTFYDMKEKTVNLIRNKDRPLFFAYTKAHNGVFWASEPWILYGCAARNQVELDKMYECAESMLHRFELVDATSVIHTTRKVEGKRPFVYQMGRGGYSSNYSGSSSGKTIIPEHKAEEKEAKKEKHKRGKLHLVQGGGRLNCIFCHDIVNLKDKRTVQVDEGIYVCGDCASIEDRKDELTGRTEPLILN